MTSTVNFFATKSFSKFIITCSLILGCLAFTSNEGSSQTIRTQHGCKANSFAKQTAYTLMKKICPNTGKNARASVTHWVYDEYTRTYEITMNAYWTGRPWALADTQNYNIQGVLTVSKDGRRTSFTKTYENRAVEVTISNNNWFEGSVIAIGALAVLSSSN